MMNYIFGLLMIALVSCQGSDTTPAPEEIVNKAIAYSGKSKLNSNILKFDFRKYTYKAIPTCDGFRFERISKSKPIRDVLVNEKLTRYYKDSLVKLADSTAFSYYESVNSVHYFTQLPLRLKDEAVNLSYLGKEEIQDKTYHKLKVKFSEDGGGVDFEDVYIYWFDVEDFSMDYLAYSFIVNEGGLRFRKAINRRTIEGVVFQDYENYKPKVKSKNLKGLADLFENDKLELLSVIENKDIKLTPVELNCK
ncbi:DUF6503 family protein [Psychroflexus sediminis]|uniref:Deoxyribose-phosphate aldolase n=1 Tax=Psychroflexus sediminis TaxID=470826 RepID=A0A1G7VNM4_9FLAO|nr:DUF6503 family protein [Psychroflexus sediminis]SDG61373.1 hypothetical protein SAMN04488027_10429 [Psychroflexus sediminis]